MSGNKIGRISTDGRITEILLPGTYSYPLEIVAGPDGNLWFAERGIAATARSAASPRDRVTPGR